MSDKNVQVCLIDCHFVGELRPTNEHGADEIKIGRAWNRDLASMLEAANIGCEIISSDDTASPSVESSMQEKIRKIMALPSRPVVCVETHLNAIKVAGAHGLVVEAWRYSSISLALAREIQKEWQASTRKRISCVEFPGATGWLQSRMFHLMSDHGYDFVLLEAGNLYNMQILDDMREHGALYHDLMKGAFSGIRSLFPVKQTENKQ